MVDYVDDVYKADAATPVLVEDGQPVHMKQTELLDHVVQLVRKYLGGQKRDEKGEEKTGGIFKAEDLDCVCSNSNPDCILQMYRRGNRGEKEYAIVNCGVDDE